VEGLAKHRQAGGMDTAITVRRAGNGTQTASVRQAAAVTDLAPSKAVGAAPAAAKTSPDAGNAHHFDPLHTGELILDAQSREVIYRTADLQSRRVLRQVPEVAARRLRAYTRSAKAGDSPGDPHADIEV
jgi:hypothetical protein